MKIDEGFVVLFLFLSVIALSGYYKYQSCEWRWKHSDYLYKYEILGGCKINTKHGWIPEKNIASLPSDMHSRKAIENELYRREYTKRNGEWVDKDGKTIRNKQNETDDPLGIR